MFLSYPHSIHKYYGTTLIDFRGNLFREIDDLLPYYISSAFLYRINKIFNKPKYSKDRIFKYYILYALKILCVGHEKFINNKNKPNKNLQLLLKMLNNDDIIEEAIEKITPNLHDSARCLRISPYSAVTRKDFTDEVTKRIVKLHQQLLSK